MRGNILEFLDQARADAPVHGDKLRELAQLTMYSIAVLACATGKRTALAPGGPYSIDTVAFRKSDGWAKKMFCTSAGFDHTPETVMTESGP
jgi:hypothetical protein